MRNPARLLLALLVMSMAAGSRAVVIDVLPYPDTQDWTDAVFTGTSMIRDPSAPQQAPSAGDR